MNKYKITITETRLEEEEVGPFWEKVGEKEVEREPRLITDANRSNTRIETVMGYTPKTTKNTLKARDIYTQIVDGKINLKGIISAVNAASSPTDRGSGKGQR